MNQEKIGKFILELRKEKDMTQQVLADKLGVSDKTISKWENGRGMPDLSLIKPLCNILGISINELLSGERLDKKDYSEKLEENIINTINYTNEKVLEKNNFIGILFIVFGLIISISAVSILPSESSWGSIYSILGGIVSLIGVFKCSIKLNRFKRLLVNLSYFVLFIIMLFIVDYLSVVNIKQAPRFSYYKETGEDMIVYKALLYNVYRINRGTRNEYYIVDTKKEYTEDTVPISPFNRDKAGIDNIIKYKNKYVGNNSNDGDLIRDLPLAEYGFVFEIDSVNLGLTIDYFVTSWYVDEDFYLEKTLLYNAVSIFTLIDNVDNITFNFCGKSYQVYRGDVEKFYPYYSEIVSNGIDKDSFNEYLESKMNDSEFVKKIFDKLFVK